jgi:hypothetical protein
MGVTVADTIVCAEPYECDRCGLSTDELPAGVDPCTFFHLGHGQTLCKGCDR